MKTEIPKTVLKMMWDLGDVAKERTTQNIITAARNNDIKIPNEDMQKLAYIVNSTIDEVCSNSSSNFETRLTDMVAQEAGSKSPKTK